MHIYTYKDDLAVDMPQKAYGGLDIWDRFDHLYEFINTHNPSLLVKWWNVIDKIKEDEEE